MAAFRNLRFLQQDPMDSLNLSSAGKRADNSDPFDNQGHCHNHILLLYHCLSPTIWLSKGTLELRLIKQASPLSAYTGAGRSSESCSC